MRTSRGIRARHHRHHLPPPPARGRPPIKVFPLDVFIRFAVRLLAWSSEEMSQIRPRQENGVGVLPPRVPSALGQPDVDVDDDAVLRLHGCGTDRRIDGSTDGQTDGSGVLRVRVGGCSTRRCSGHTASRMRRRERHHAIVHCALQGLIRRVLHPVPLHLQPLDSQVPPPSFIRSCE